MRHFLTALTLLGVFALSSPAKALMIAPSPISQRVARADGVVVGKVTAVAEKTEKAEMFKGDERQMQVATVAVEEAVLGKKTKTVKVAFFPPPPPPVAGPNGIRLIRGGRGSVQLSVGQDGLFFLTKHPTKKGVYFVQQYFDVVGRAGDATFAPQLDEARKYAKLLKDAKANLDSKDATVRSETAMMLVTRYRSAPAGGSGTLESVPAAESKKILLGLAAGDWKPANTRIRAASPLTAFSLLGLQPKDGWVAPKVYTEYPDAAKKWLDANAGKYEMKRFVRESDKKDATEPE